MTGPGELNLIKLCVGIDKPEELRRWIAYRLAQAAQSGRPAEYIHTTRMMPRRRAALLDGGSLYWVMKGFVQARQRLVDLRPVTDADGIPRCQVVLDRELVATRPVPRRPFQGWRYLTSSDAPADLPPGAAAEDIPDDMRRQLLELGLI